MFESKADSSNICPCLGQRVNHKLAPFALGAASNRRHDMDLLALVEVERLDRCNRGGGGEIGRRWLELAEFHFLPAQLTWLCTLHHKMKNPDCTSSMATCEIQQSHLLKKFRNTSRWKWQPFPTKPPRRYPSDPPPNSSRQQNKTVRGCCEKSTVYMTLPSASTNMTHSRFHLEIHSAEP